MMCCGTLIQIAISVGAEKLTDETLTDEKLTDEKLPAAEDSIGGIAMRNEPMLLQKRFCVP